MESDLDERVQKLEMIASRLENIFSVFQLDLHYVSKLLELYPRVLENIWNNGERVTAQHWRFLPNVELSAEGFDRKPVIAKRKFRR